MNEISYVGKHLRTYNVDEHNHEAWELIYCTSGHGIFVFAEKSISYASGDIVVIPPQVKHSNYSEDGFTNIYLNIQEASLPFPNAVKVADDADQHILNVFKDAFYHFYNQTNNKQMILNSLGNLLANYMIAYQETKPSSPIVEAIESKIVQNFPDSSFELDEYLKTFPFSYDYLRKLFKRERGNTPHAYLMSLRLTTAACLLSEVYGDETNITEIAYLCGFKEPLYFSRIFKERYGVSPLNYIKKQKNV